MLTRRLSASRTLAILSALSLAAVNGCATPAKSASDKPTERVYVGWVRFAGEFSLYSQEKAFENSTTSHCVSGALPPEKQREAAAQFSGKRVRVRARAVPWSELPPDALTMSNAGSPITNWCGDRVVLFATEMKVYESPSEMIR